MRLGWEACHVADRTYDPRRQDGSYAEDLGEGGAGGFYLGFNAPVQARDLPVKCADSKRSTSEANRRRRRAEAPPLGRRPRKMHAARSAESGRATPPGRRSRRSPCRRLERPGTLGHQVLAPLGEQAQHLRGGLGIDLRQSPVARGGQGGGEGVEPVVLAGVASEAREHPHPRRELGGHVHHGLAGGHQPPRQVPTSRPPAFSTAQRRSGNRSAQRSRRLVPALGPAGSWHARGARPRLRRPQRRRPTPCEDRLRSRPS